ncbi:glycosyltransferase family 2 protein [Candidatus Uhrbacteria bacterium]|nr:glycosyltransferase family 2 protein [Candidatus Uhrbacteria bacterium]
MLHGKKIIVVMPAYNAGRTLETTHREIPSDIVDEVILVDDGSTDSTVDVSRRLGITTIVHPENRGYGGNQKTCYATALAHGADVVIMLHPDYQYDPHLLLPMVSMVTDGPYDVVIGSRILGQTESSNMPVWKYISNRFLTLFENILLGAKLSEYHTGYRAFTREVLESLPLGGNSEDFVFDNEMLAQIIMKGYGIGEVSCPAKYFPEASSINFRRSVRYGLGVLRVSLVFRLHRWGIIHSKLFA